MEAKPVEHFVNQLDLFFVLFAILVKVFKSIVIGFLIRKSFYELFDGDDSLIELIILQKSIGGPDVIPGIVLIISQCQRKIFDTDGEIIRAQISFTQEKSRFVVIDILFEQILVNLYRSLGIPNDQFTLRFDKPGLPANIIT